MLQKMVECALDVINVKTNKQTNQKRYFKAVHSKMVHIKSLNNVNSHRGF